MSSTVASPELAAQPSLHARVSFDAPRAWIAWFALSLLAHGGALSAIYAASERNNAARQRRLQEVQVEIQNAPPPKPPAAPEASAEPPQAEPEPRPVRPLPPQSKTAALPNPDAPKTAEPPPAARETAADFTGVTLSNDQGSWSSAVGSGETMSGPITGPGIVTGRNRAGVEAGGVLDGQGTKPAFVPLSDLSQRPEAPDLNAALLRNYPPEARAQGIPGVAVVRARVDTDGRLANLRVNSATRPEFGEACIQTLRGSRWSAPRDRAGAAVTTEITYTCRFEVRY